MKSRPLLLALAALALAALPAAAQSTYCTAGTLDGTDPTWTRLTGTSNGPGTCVVSSTVVPYDYYEFTLTGCTDLTQQITISLCSDGTAAPCNAAAPATALTDSLLEVYQRAAGAPGAPGTPIFSPTAQCTNFIIGNDDGGGACGALSKTIFASTLVGGNFAVVVTAFGPTGTGASPAGGNYNLWIDTGTTGCTLTRVTPTPVELQRFSAH